MTIHAISLRRWVVQGSILGSLVLSLYYLIYFSIVLDAVGFPGGVLSGVVLYIKIVFFCMPIAAAVALIVGWVAKRRQHDGRIRFRAAVGCAAMLGFLPSLILLLGSLSGGITTYQAINIVTGLGLPPATIAVGTAIVLLRKLDTPHSG